MLTHPMISLHRLMPIVLVALMAASCATAPPVQEMSDARQAIAAAREAGAAEFAARQLVKAENLLADAQRQLEAAGSSAYWSARQSALSAKEIAFEALLKSRAAREEPAHAP